MADKPSIDQMCHYGDVRSTTPIREYILIPEIKNYSPDAKGGYYLYLKSKNLISSAAGPADPNWVAMFDDNTMGGGWSSMKSFLIALQFDFQPKGQCLFAKNLNDPNVTIDRPTGAANWQIAEFILAQLRTKNLVASLTWILLEENETFEGSELYLGDQSADSDQQTTIDYSSKEKYRTAYTWPGC